MKSGRKKNDLVTLTPCRARTSSSLATVPGSKVDHIRGLPISASRGLVARLRQEVRMMDERALAHDETYWSVIFEELGYEVS